VRDSDQRRDLSTRFERNRRKGARSLDLHPNLWNLIGFHSIGIKMSLPGLPRQSIPLICQIFVQIAGARE
jgi:hypothetical protein